MKLTEKERLMLVSKKEKILELTHEILEIMEDPKQKIEVKKKITSILSKLSTIASYAKSDRNLPDLCQAVNLTFVQMDILGKNWTVLSPWIQVLCNTFNTTQFEFTKERIKFKIPKINLTLLKTG